MSDEVLNIAPENIAGKCDLKCAYSFKYPNSSCKVKNMGDMLNITYDQFNTPPVTFNNNKYQVSNISIISPSGHKFIGAPTIGEIIITHSAVDGGSPLIVCVPIIVGGDTIPASKLLDIIISATASSAPSQGEETMVSMQDFTLETIVPKKPFFSYTFARSNYVVFGKMFAIPLTGETLKKLKSINAPFTKKIFPGGPPLFINNLGPNHSGNLKGGEIFIDCQPTGSSDETVAVTTLNPIDYDFLYYIKLIIFSPYFIMFILLLIACAIFILLLYATSFVFKSIGNYHLQK